MWGIGGPKKGWKQATLGGKRWGDLLECTRDLGVRDSQDSKGGTLDEMPNSRERELVESTSSRKRDGVATLQSKILTHNCSYEGYAGTKLKKSLQKRRSSNRPKVESSSRRCLKT